MDMRHPYILCLLIKHIFEAHRPKQAVEYVVLSLKSFAICPCADSVHYIFLKISKGTTAVKNNIVFPERS